MGFDYIIEGQPEFPVPGSPALLFDKENNNLYVSNGLSTNWIIIGNSGGSNDSVQNITSSQPIGFDGTSNTFIKCVAGGSGITLTLPNAIGFAGQQITFKMMDTGPGDITIIPNPGAFPLQSIDGQSSYVLSSQYQAVTLESDNSNWLVRSTNVSDITDTVFFFSSNGGVEFPSNSNIQIQGTGGTLGISILLPNAVGNSGRRLSAMKVDSGVGIVNLVGQGGQMVNNGFGYALENQYQSVILQSDGANYFVYGTAG